MTVWLALVSSAFAGGYYYADSGIVANGRGCAFVAGADNQFAQYYNPAGIIRVTRPTLNVGASGVMQSVTFDRTDADGNAIGTAKNEGGMFAVPEMGFVTPIGKDFSFAFGFTSGFSPAYEFPEDSVARYTIIDTTIWNFQIGPTVAWRPIPQLTVAVGPQWQVMRVEEHLKVTTSGQDDPKGDVSVDANVWDKFTPSANFGVLVEPIKEISIGVMVQPPQKYHGKGDGELDFTGNGLENVLDQKVYTDDDIALELALPLFLRTGVAVRPMPELEIEVGFFYEGWRRLQDITVSDIDVTVTGGNGLINQEVEDEIALPAGFRDTWSVRLGGEYQVNDILELRAGGFYESGSLKPNGVSVALVDTNKFMAGIGTSIHLIDDHLVLDAYGSAVKYQNLNIRDSTVTQINVYGGDEAVVGNGDIRSLGLATGLAARWQFGKELRPRDGFVQ